MDRIKAELITIGDELLYGQTIDTNASFIGEKITEAGIELVYHTTVGDDSETLLNAIAQAMKRVDIVLATGGLGPTHDDITKKIICKYFRRQLVFHDSILKELEDKYKAQGMVMPPINQNQALLPQGAKFFENRIGSALGILFRENSKIFISMPGVPSEMKIMIKEQVLPYFKEKISGQINIIHRKIRTIGIAESVIFEKVKNIIEEKSPVKIAFLPSFRGVDIRLTVKSDNEVKAREAIAEIERQFTEIIGKYIFGCDNDELPDIIGKQLADRGLTIAVAESCTGGMLGNIFTAIPGSSDYFLGGVISYSNDIKIKILNVPALTIERHGAVSAETVKYMAEGVKKLTGASIGAAITGIAGPTGGTPEKPVGLTYIGIAAEDSTKAKDFHYGKDRNQNRLRACYSALDMVRRYLNDID
ncbi:MAG: competence/damage-inducible protein A [candidate division Zixibacteria bacterium]|nr:competence/damage-inducible protein A [candidate division Zixibacteria bacterium]